jgi:hypothetical protein
MGDVEKSNPATATASHTDDLAHHDHPVLDLSSWKYKPTKIGPLTIPPYASPETQLLLVSLVCFLCPGMFNALSGLGAGGGTDPRAADDANIALYSTFAVVGFFAGTFANKLGIKISLSFGGLGYCVYCIAFLVYKHTHNYGFNVFAGFLLGCCAGILWCAQGAIMMSYPQEHQKGRFISFFWIVFNLGGVIGSLVNLPLLREPHTVQTDRCIAGPSRREHQRHWRPDRHRRHLHRIHRPHRPWSRRRLHFDRRQKRRP